MALISSAPLLLCSTNAYLAYKKQHIKNMSLLFNELSPKYPGLCERLSHKAIKSLSLQDLRLLQWHSHSSL